MYRVLVADESLVPGERVWREVGADDVSDGAWNWAWTYLLLHDPEFRIAWDRIGVLTDLEEREQ